MDMNQKLCWFQNSERLYLTLCTKNNLLINELEGKTETGSSLSHCLSHKATEMEPSQIFCTTLSLKVFEDWIRYVQMNRIKILRAMKNTMDEQKDDVITRFDKQTSIFNQKDGFQRVVSWKLSISWLGEQCILKKFDKTADKRYLKVMSFRNRKDGKDLAQDQTNGCSGRVGVKKSFGEG